MAYKRKITVNEEKRLKTSLSRMKSGSSTSAGFTVMEDTPLLPLSERIRKLLGILKHKPLKATEMINLIMYDIENDKVRNRIARYLIKKGCIRIQKSVFILRSPPQEAQKIYEALKDVNSYYENEDSILLVPVNSDNLRIMKIIGRQLSLSHIIDPPSTLFV